MTFAEMRDLEERHRIENRLRTERYEALRHEGPYVDEYGEERSLPPWRDRPIRFDSDEDDE